MTSSLQRFINLLLQSGVVTRGEIRELRAQLSDEDQSDEATSENYVLQQLADSGHLTDFQASAVHEGKSDELVLDDYLIIDEIGRGGMGRVYKARHTLMRREVAVKFTLADDPDQDSDQRFRREVEGLSKLVHPNIVSALDAGYRGKHCYLVMEFVEGTDLSIYIRKQGPMNFNDAMGVMIQAAEGLKYVHHKKIVHRDIKPGNLLFTPDHKVKVLDVGLAKFERREEDENSARTATELTHSGAIVGTVDYMAPEQALNSHDVTPAADVYSLGCTLHYLLTGKPPFRQRGKSVLERVVAHREMEIPKLSQLGMDVPKDFDPVFEKMLAKESDQRYSDAGELLVDLKRMQGDYNAAPSSDTMVMTDHVPLPGKAKANHLALAGIPLLVIGVIVGLIAYKHKTDPVATVSKSVPTVPKVAPASVIVQPELPFDLMEYVDTSTNVLAGEGWQLVNGSLTIPGRSLSKLLIPVSILSEYQLLGEVRRVSGNGPFILLLPVRGKSQCFVLIDSRRNDVPVSGFGFNSAGRLVVSEQNVPLSRDEASRLRLEVRTHELSYFLNDRLVVRWNGDPGQLRVAGGWSATLEPAIVVGSNHDASFEVSNLRVESLESPRLDQTMHLSGSVRFERWMIAIKGRRRFAGLTSVLYFSTGRPEIQPFCYGATQKNSPHQSTNCSFRILNSLATISGLTSNFLPAREAPT